MITQEKLNKMKGELDKLKNDNKYKFADQYTLTDKDSIYNGLRDFYKIYAMGAPTSSEMNELTKEINKSKDKDDIVSASRSLLGMYETVVKDAETKLKNTMGNILERKQLHLKKGVKETITLSKSIYLPSTEVSIESNLKEPYAKLEMIFSSNSENLIRNFPLSENPFKGSPYSKDISDDVPLQFDLVQIQIELMNHDELHLAITITDYK